MTLQSDPREMIKSARAGGYAVGAYNMHNDETCEALLWAAEQAESHIWASNVPMS
jgi:fructose-bisphosphate aldolase class II